MTREYFYQNADLEVEIYDVRSGKIYRTMTCKESDAERQCVGDKDYRIIGYALEQSDKAIARFLNRAEYNRRHNPKCREWALNEVVDAMLE